MTNLMRRVLVLAPVALALLFTPASSLADASKRRSLREEIDRYLYEMTNELRDVPSDSSTSDLDRTIDYAGRVEEKARDLKNEAEDDSDARRIGEQYPDIARRYRDYARYLREMKNGHRKLDEWPKRCEEANRALDEKLRSLTESHNPRAVEEVPRLAREYGKVGKELLEQAERHRNEMYAWYDRVDDFSDSDGKWSDVRSAFHASGKSMYEHVQRQQEQMKREEVCGNLSKEERNPVVERAMQKVFEGKKGVELVYGQIDRQLTDMASAIDGLAGDSDASDIQRARGYVDEIQRLIEQLDRIRGNDDEARKRVEAWRNNVTGGRAGLDQLKILKDAQFLADRAPEKCREATERLRELIRKYLDEREENAVDQLKLRARSLSGPIKEGLSKTDEQHPNMERALSDAQRFSASDGGWRSVSDKHRASAQAIFDYWTKARASAHAACDELAKGELHQEVVAAVSNLTKDRSESANQLLVLEADHRKWEESIKELREWYKQDTKVVRDMFCKLPESPGDYAEGDAFAAQLAQIADRMRDRLRPKWSQISRDAELLLSRAEVLVRAPDKAARPGAARVRKAVAERMASLQNLLDNELNGSNDPEVRAKMEFGKNEHKRIQADSGKCTVSEVTFGNRRVDCIYVSSGTCYVVEIKPNNDDAKRRGEGQIRDGINQIEKELGGKKKKSELTGKLEVFRDCFDEASEKPRLERQLRVYEYCPPDGEMFKDFLVP